GMGGSSRSLYHAIRHLDRSACSVEVWCLRDGPIRRLYEAIGVACRIEPEMPRLSALPKSTRNLLAWAEGWLAFRRSRRFRRRLAEEVARRFDRVHFNHEGLFLLARWLRRRVGVPLTMHVRTNLTPGMFAALQLRSIAANVDHAVFITENERRTFAGIAGRMPRHTVIHNIAEPLSAELAPHPAVPADDRFKVACLSNFAMVRGTDRVLDVAAAVVARGRRDVLFVMAGDMRLQGTLPPDLTAVARAGGTLAAAAAARGLGDVMLFLGHVGEPERVLLACDALIKPTRESNPWGRDVIEALAAARPVLSCGTDATFVEDGVTGVLQREFDAAAMAAAILRLAADRDLSRRLGAAGHARAARLCDGPARAADLLAVWQTVGRAA
ncbi:MAG: glycosyltransferase, partial [Alphaproteobacteria bacterium]|nr:glycosyltransferase [Alphaproteobacteria bacterium]